MRLPSKSKVIKELSPSDRRVKVFGTVLSVNKEEGKVMLDDGTGSVEIILNNLELIEKLDSYRQGDTVMVIGWANPSGVDCEVLRKVAGFDPSRYRQVLEVLKDVRRENE